MSNKELEKQIIESYQRDEQMMVLVFAQWCVNNGLDPAELYSLAYPEQQANEALQQAMALTVPKEEAGDIPHETVLGVLSLYNNVDLSFVVTEEIKKLSRRK